MVRAGQWQGASGEGFDTVQSPAYRILSRKGRGFDCSTLNMDVAGKTVVISGSSMLLSGAARTPFCG